MYVRTIPTYGPKHDTRGWIRGCREGVVNQFIEIITRLSTSYCKLQSFLSKAQSDSIPMKLHKLQGSFLGQGRPLKTKPWLRRYASPPKLRREVLSAVASNFKASKMMFPPTLGNKHLNSKHHVVFTHPSCIIYHISYIIYTYTPHILSYFHILSYIIYNIYIYISFIHPQTKSKTTTGPSRSRRRSCNWSRCSDRCGGGRIPHSLGREMEYMIYSIKIYVISRDVVHHRLCMIHIYIHIYIYLHLYAIDSANIILSHLPIVSYQTSHIINHLNLSK